MMLIFAWGIGEFCAKCRFVHEPCISKCPKDDAQIIMKDLTLNGNCLVCEKDATAIKTLADAQDHIKKHARIQNIWIGAD